jgi:nucleoside-diphosphate-sugar epimerase/aryl carrier-like protein
MSPFFHFMGLLNMVTPIFFATPFLLSPDKPLTTELLSQIVDEKNPETAILPPSILEELSSSDVGMQILKDFHMICFGGAPLASEVGDRISEVTHLQSVLGSSECGLFGTLKHQDKNDWNYFEWNSAHGLEMRDIGDSFYELVVPRGKSRKEHSVFHTYPEKQEYRTGDIFVEHPEKGGLWLYHGRLDDVIVLSNGEKFNPTSMEEIISSHPLIARTVILGQGRFQSCALVEPYWDAWKGEENTLVNEIWPIVQKANDAAPGHARLMRDRIGLTCASKPFMLTPKGTIQRRTVLKDYADEIEALYTRQAENDVTRISKDAPISYIKAYIANVLEEMLSMASIDDNADLFALGVDSLQTLRLGQILQAALKATRPEVTVAAFNSQQLYSHPTICLLSEYVSNLLQGQDLPSAASLSETDIDREIRIAELVTKYSDDLDESHAVILTGSTGSLGTYLLYELLRDHSVSKIYCLNRSSDAASRQLKSLQEKGLVRFERFPRRVEFLEAKSGSERLGLEAEKYEILLQEVDTIIHNAWKVNFNHQVEAFEDPHIQGVRRLVDFSIASEKTAHIHFVSSISTIEGYGPEKGPSIPERIFTDPTVALRQGYGESKHISERICASASARRGVPTSIHRVGQIGGPTTKKGMWNKQEWVPSLVATSKTIKQIPCSLGSVSVQWVPVVSLSQYSQPNLLFAIVKFFRMSRRKSLRILSAHGAQHRMMSSVQHSIL